MPTIKKLVVSGTLALMLGLGFVAHVQADGCAEIYDKWNTRAFCDLNGNQESDQGERPYTVCTYNEVGEPCCTPDNATQACQDILALTPPPTGECGEKLSELICNKANSYDSIQLNPLDGSFVTCNKLYPNPSQATQRQACCTYQADCDSLAGPVITPTVAATPTPGPLCVNKGWLSSCNDPDYSFHCQVQGLGNDKCCQDESAAWESGYACYTYSNQPCVIKNSVPGEACEAAHHYECNAQDGWTWCCQNSSAASSIGLECGPPSPTSTLAPSTVPTPTNIPEPTTLACGQLFNKTLYDNGLVICNCPHKEAIDDVTYCCGWSDPSDPTNCLPNNPGGIENPFEPPSKETLDSLNPLLIGGGDSLDGAVASPYASDLADPGGIVSRLLEFIFPISGSILFAMLVWGGFEMLVGAPTKKSIDAGKQRITAAVIGFLLLFASYWLMQIIEVIFGIVVL